MGALLSALGKNPRAAWGRAVAAAAAAAILGSAMIRSHQGLQSERKLCQRAGQKLAGVWDDEAKRRIEQAFLSTKQSYARTAWQTVERSLDAHAREWIASRTEACEATYVRAEQSAAACELRALCLEQRLSEAKALTALFARADAQMVQGAVKAIQALSSLKTCSAHQAIRSKLKAPDDLSMRAQVEEVRARIAEAKMLHATGNHARAAEVANAAVEAANLLGYKPLRAEALYALAQNEERRGERAAAQAALEDAIIAAQASSHDEVAAKAWILLVSVVGYQQGRAEEAQRLARFAGAAVERLGPEHPLEGQMHQVLGRVFAAQNEHAQSLASFERAVAIKQRSRGGEDPELAEALHELGMARARLGQYPQALEDHQRA
ncbi:MAG TPA: tetratricopeptide repeat protein, partial [Myxococcaceae bacterium]|nr:tetratricopeptide repeat protein [Myxococcaceae bacterium]